MAERDKNDDVPIESPKLTEETEQIDESTADFIREPEMDNEPEKPSGHESEYESAEEEEEKTTVMQPENKKQNTEESEKVNTPEINVSVPNELPATSSQHPSSEIPMELSKEQTSSDGTSESNTTKDSVIAQLDSPKEEKIKLDILKDIVVTEDFKPNETEEICKPDYEQALKTVATNKADYEQPLETVPTDKPEQLLETVAAQEDPVDQLVCITVPDLDPPAVQDEIKADENVTEVKDLIEEPCKQDESLEEGEIIDDSTIDEYGISGETTSDFIDEEGGVEETAEAECEFLEDDIENGELEEGEIVDDDDDGEYVEGERQQGDGEESVSPTPSAIQKVLDDDEDRRNPQYIPKKGAFYEHDDRMTSDQEQASGDEDPEEEKEKKEKVEDKKKKKLWLEDGKWKHDMFRPDEQGPKAREELYTSYGYDIRNEESAPRARRRRRYGRGPNKYTRNWQDEEAYYKLGGGGAGEPGEREDREPCPRQGEAGEQDDREAHYRQGRGGGRRGGNRRGRGGFGGYNNQNINHNSEEYDDEMRENQRLSRQNPNVNRSAHNLNNNNNRNMLDKEEFPALPITNTECPTEQQQQQTLSIGGIRGSKPPFPSNGDKNNPEDKSVKTITFENSRLSNRNSLEKEGEEEDQVESEKLPEMPRVPKGPGRGRGRRNSTETEVESRHYIENSGIKEHRLNNTAPRHRRLKAQQEPPDPRPSSPDDRLAAENDLNDPYQSSQIKTNYREGPPTQSLQGNKGGGEGRSKRYSTIRQRGVMENPPPMAPNFPPRHIHQNPNRSPQYFEKTAYPGGNIYSERMSGPKGNQHPPPNQPVNPIMAGAPLFSAYTPAAYQESFALRAASLPAAPRMFPAPGIGPGQAVAVAPAYIPQPPPPNPTILNFGPTAAPPALASGLPQYPYQQFTSHQPPQAAVTPPLPAAVVSQHQELYRDGVTYYDMHSQQMGRMPPQRRPKAAIPIVAPLPGTQLVEENCEGLMMSSSVPVET